MTKNNRAERAGTCKQATALIAEYLARALAPETTSQLEHHLDLCPDCIAFLKTYKKTIELTRSLLRSDIFPELPPSKRQALRKTFASRGERG